MPSVTSVNGLERTELLRGVARGILQITFRLSPDSAQPMILVFNLSPSTSYSTLTR